MDDIVLYHHECGMTGTSGLVQRRVSPTESHPVPPTPMPPNDLR